MARRAKVSEAVEDESVNPTDDHAEPMFADDADHAEPAPEAPVPEGVKVMLLCKGVFLPEDLLGADWASSQNTKRYDGETNDRRTKLTVHPTLAAFLQERKQAEILD